MILALNRRIVEQDRSLREGAWVKHGPATRTILRGPIHPLREQTVGIIGFGRIGKSVAARLKPFGVTLIVADLYADPETIRQQARSRSRWMTSWRARTSSRFTAR